MLILLLTSFLAVLVAFNYRVARSVLYPPFLFSAMWLLVFVVYQASLIEIDPFHPQTLAMVGLGALLYTVGGLLAKAVPEPLLSVHVDLGRFSAKPLRESWINYLMLLVCFAGMLFIIRHTFAAAASGVGSNVLARARQAGLAGEGAEETYNPISVYTPVWSALFATLFLLERRKLFWPMASISFLASLFTTGRGPIIFLFASLLAAYLLRERKLGFRPAFAFSRIPLLAIFALYTLLIFTNKDTSGLERSVSGVIVYVVTGYIVAPIAGMDYVLMHAQDYAGVPHHTFKFFLGIASRLHLTAYQPPPLLDEFVSVPFWTNVYTGFKFYYTDFGFAGCMAAVFVIAFLHSLLYRKAIGNSELGAFLYAATVFPLVMFIFDDLYSAFGETLDIVAVGVLYFATRSLFTVGSSSRRGLSLRALPARRRKAPSPHPAVAGTGL